MTHVFLKERKKGLLAALAELKAMKNAKEQVKLRKICDRTNVPLGSLGRAYKRKSTAESILEGIQRQGRKQRLSDKEEVMKMKVLMEYKNLGSPLDRSYAIDLVQTLIETCTM